jgi:prepilin-type N-terminal cleavage/methylation domain-containing protein
MKKSSQGFTIIELVVVIVIIAILATISIVGFTTIQQSARNTQRSSQISSVAEALEKYYMKNGEYPACAAIVSPATPNTVATTVLPGIDPNLLTAPTATAGTNSFICNTNPSTVQFGYFGGGNSCILKYQEESTGSVKQVDCRHHATSPNYTLTLVGVHCTPTGAGSYAAGTIVAINCGSFDQFWTATGWTGSSGCSGGGISKNITCYACFTQRKSSDPMVATDYFCDAVPICYNEFFMGKPDSNLYRWEYSRLSL